MTTEVSIKTTVYRATNCATAGLLMTSCFSMTDAEHSIIVLGLLIVLQHFT